MGRTGSETAEPRGYETSLGGPTGAGIGSDQHADANVSDRKGEVARFSADSFQLGGSWNRGGEIGPAAGVFHPFDNVPGAVAHFANDALVHNVPLRQGGAGIIQNIFVRGLGR